MFVYPGPEQDTVNTPGRTAVIQTRCSVVLDYDFLKFRND